MNSIQVIFIIFIFIAAGAFFFVASLNFARYFMQRDVNVRSLLVGLKPKLWMTACLGSFFFPLYYLIVVLSSYFIDEQVKLSFFRSALKDPVFFIYAGLLIFMAFSISIIGVRSIIKRIYNSKIR